MKYYISQSPTNPVSRLFTALVAALALVGFFFFGLIVVVFLLAVLLAFGLVLRVRAWWLQRKPAANIAVQGQAAEQGQVIDAEYIVVHRRHE
jgi:fumarate reductase subunit C